MKTLCLLLGTLLTINIFCQSGYYITSKDSTRLYVEEFGAGEPLVLLSGGPGLDPAYLQPIWENVSKDHRAIILHQRGTGRSPLETIDSRTMAMENYTNDLETLREHLGLQKLTLIGHSWGGMLSMEYTSRFPDKVQNLILLATGGPTSKFFAYFSDNIFMRLHESDLKEVALLDSLNKPTLRAIYPGYYFDREQALKNKATIDFEAIFNVNINLSSMSNYVLSSQERVEGLKSYMGRVTLIQGRQDPVGESTLYEIVAILPQSEAHFIEKCGHFPWLENDRQRNEFFSLQSRAIEAK